MRQIVFTRPDGGLSVVHPVINTMGEVAGFTEVQAEQRAFAKLPANAINPKFIETADIPVDRTFRNAWEDNGSINVNMPKAREIHREKLRALRKPLLEVLDMAYLRADEQGDVAEKARIAAEKQKLRDVTADPRIEAAQTPEQLKAVLPDVLK